MDKYAKLREVFKAMTQSVSPLTTAEAVSIQGDTCTIKVNGMEISGVRLRATSGALSNKLLLTPAIGSHVLLGSQSGDWRDISVIGYDDIAKVELKSDNITVELDAEQGKIEINGGLLGGLVKIRELEANLNSLKLFAEAIHTALPTALSAIGAGAAANGASGASSYSGSMAGRTIDIKDMEDTKVTH